MTEQAQTESIDGNQTNVSCLWNKDSLFIPLLVDIYNISLVQWKSGNSQQMTGKDANSIFVRPPFVVQVREAQPVRLRYLALPF